MNRKVLVGLTIIGLGFGSLVAATPSYAAGDCPPEEGKPFYYCVLDNVIPVGGPGSGGGGLYLSPRYQMAFLP